MGRVRRIRDHRAIRWTDTSTCGMGRVRDYMKWSMGTHTVGGVGGPKSIGWGQRTEISRL